MKKQTALLLWLVLATTCMHAQTAKIFYNMSQAPTTGTGAIIDATGNTTGTLSNALTADPDFIQGAVPQSLTAWDFSPTEGYIRVASNTTTASLGDIAATNGITIAFWANFNYDGSYIFRRLSGIGSTFDILMNTSGVEFRFQDPNYIITSNASDGIFDGTWQHLAVTFDFTSTTNNLVMYLNGNPIKTQSHTVAASFNSPTNDLIIGARHNGDWRNYPGKMDDYIIFDEALSAVDITKLYQEGGYVFCDPAAYTYAPTSQVAGYTYAWDNYTTDDNTGVGTRPVIFDFTDVNTIKHAPPVGIHPRVYFNPDEIPDIQNRLTTTESGKWVSRQIHAYTTLLNLGWSTGLYQRFGTYALDCDGNRLIDNEGFWDNEPYYTRLIAGDATVFSDAGFNQTRRSLLGSIMALEAFECLMNQGTFDPDTGENYDDRAADLATAITFWANHAITDPMVSPNGNDFRYFPATHMALAYDINYNAMTTPQRDIVRQAIVKVIPDAPRYGVGVTSYAHTSNWSTLNNFEIIPNLAIEGEAGYKPDLTHDWMRSLHIFINYGWYPSGAGYEGLGKNYMMAVNLVAAAKRGYSLLGHPHLRAYAKEFLPAITQPFGYAFTSYDVWGGSGYDAERGKYKPNSADPIGLKWIFPNDPTVDFVWRNYIRQARNNDSDGYVYQQFRPDDSYLNYMVPAAVFALDYDDVDFDTRATTAIPTDYFAPDRGLAILRSGTDSLALASQFHCRQDMGGHTHGDRNDFTLSGLGRIWVRKTYGGSPFQPMYFHSGIMIDDVGMGVSTLEGDKCRQPGKVLDYQSGNDITCVTGDATYAYTWEWDWSAQTGDHPQLGSNGWTAVTETWNDFQYQTQSEAQFNIPFYDFPSWVSAGRFERIVKREYNPMERVIRTVGMVRGNNPFMLVVDDVEKDDAVHNYKWVAQVANDLTIESNTVNLDDCRYQNDIILKEPDATGNRRLLVRILNNENYTGATPNGYLEDLEYYDFFSGNQYNPNPPFFRHRLVVESNSIAPDFRVLLYPHYNGDELPETSWNATRDSLVVRFPDEEQLIAFNPQDGGNWHKIELVNARPIDQVQLQAKVYLQGALDGGLMRDNLNTNALLPNTEPFSALGYTHYGEGGGETMVASAMTQTGNNAIVDWVVIELRDENMPSTILATRSALLQRDGDIVDVDGTSPVTFECFKAANYHVAVRHRNHLGVMTALPVFLD